jgi:hypothetical protein
MRTFPCMYPNIFFNISCTGLDLYLIQTIRPLKVHIGYSQVSYKILEKNTYQWVKHHRYLKLPLSEFFVFTHNITNMQHLISFLHISIPVNSMRTFPCMYPNIFFNISCTGQTK